MNESREKFSPSCSSPEELIAYLYGEMDGPRRAEVDDHLIDCDRCTAEFADLSFARLDVYEWHRDEFAEMATPHIAIPYGETSRYSWTERVRGIFAGYGQWATAAGAFAVLAIFAGVWFVSGRAVEISDLDKSPPAVVADAPKVNAKAAVPDSGSRNDDLPAAALDREAEHSLEYRKTPTAVTIAASKKKSPAPKSGGRKEAAQPVQARRLTKAPRLNDFEDEDDNTLRLGDLLADLDAKD